MKNYIKPFLFVLVLLSAMSTNVSLADVSDEYTLGPFTVYGVGASEAEAETSANNQMWDHIDDIINGLSSREYFQGVTIHTGSYDPFTQEYTLEYSVVIGISGPGR